MLLRNDGAAVAFGDDWQGQCTVPPLEEGATYVANAGPNTKARVILQCSFDGVAVTLAKLSGEPLCRIPAAAEDGLATTLSRATRQLHGQPFECISPAGALLRRVLADDKAATVACLLP